jgi:iron complex transport system permease protein
VSAVAARPRAVVAAVPADPRLAVRRYGLLLGAALLLVGALLLLHISIGTVPIPPAQALAVLAQHAAAKLHAVAGWNLALPQDWAVDQLTNTVIWDLRLPRALIAVLAGALLALAGAILQALTGNPLAEPDLTGASAGGVFFAVLWVSGSMAGWEFAPGGLELPFVVMAGSLLAGGLVYFLSWQRRTSAVRLVLTGVLLTTILKAATSLILLWKQNAVGAILLWMIGSLNGRTWVHWAVLWPWALVALPLGLACAGMANGLQLGDEVAASLGLRVERTRALLLAVAIMLTAGAVAAVGGLGFLGLIAPHVARRLVGDDARRVFPLSAALGAALLLAADVAARGVIDVVALPVGAVMALLGAPFLMVLLRRGVR